MNGSVNIMSIMIAFLVARNIAISYEQDDLLCGLTAIGAFFIVYTPYQMIDGQAFMTTKYLGAQGVFVAVIVALITSEKKASRKTNINQPRLLKYQRHLPSLITSKMKTVNRTRLPQRIL